jgi:hypothetical protein
VEQQYQAHKGQLSQQQQQQQQQQVPFAGWTNSLQPLQQQQSSVRPKGTGVFMPGVAQPGSPLQNQQPRSGGSTPMGGVPHPALSPTAAGAATRAGLGVIGQSPARTGSPGLLPEAAGLDCGAAAGAGGVRQELVAQLCNYMLTALNEDELLVVTATLGKQLRLVG